MTLSGCEYRVLDELYRTRRHIRNILEVEGECPGGVHVLLEASDYILGKAVSILQRRLEKQDEIEERVDECMWGEVQ